LAQQHFENSLACWRTLSDRVATARCLHNLASVVRVRGDYERAQTALREATGVFAELGDSSGAAWSINQQGDIAREQGRPDAARELYERALLSFREAGDRWGAARSLTDLAYIHSEELQYQKARAAYQEALKIFAELGHKRGMARVLEGSACLAATQRQARRALTLAAAASHLRRLISAPLPDAEQSKLERNLSSAWELLNRSEAEDAWAEGAMMSVERAVQYSLEEPRPTIAGSQDL
jgi:tetratricopeptide (TPR) repeat protein